MHDVRRYGLAILVAGTVGLGGCQRPCRVSCEPCAPCEPCVPKSCAPGAPSSTATGLARFLAPVSANSASPAAPVSPAATAKAEPAAARVLVEGTIVRIPAARAVEALGATRGATGLAMEQVSATEAVELLARAHAADGEVLQLPSIVVASGDEASIFVGEASDASSPRAPSADGHAAALADAAWTGRMLHVRATVPGPGRFGFEVACILRGPPPVGASGGTTTLHGQMRVAAMADGDAILMILVGGPPAALGDRHLLLVTPRILPPDRAEGSPASAR